MNKKMISSLLAGLMTVSLVGCSAGGTAGSAAYTPGTYTGTGKSDALGHTVTVEVKVTESAIEDIKVVEEDFDCGILICGTGVGISIAANKVKGVRAGVCSDVATAHLIKEHNNANIIAFGARIVGSELAKDIVKAYLDAEFMGGRHQMRVDMISDLEK
jgi:RpiB/LacA/LacB family sugar-phosphate isomerase